eukprot:c4131_g1_i1 orf=69-500(-)
MALIAQMQSSSAASSMDPFYKPHAEHSAGISSLPLRVLEKIMNEPTVIEHEDSGMKKPTPLWLSSNYIDLHLRSAKLVNYEAKGALQRHFERTRERSLQKSGEVQQDGMVSKPVVWDPSLEPLLTMPNADMYEDRSFLEEAFC